MPRAVLVSAAVFALVFAAMNPDAWVAWRNIDRFEAGSSLDTGYLSHPQRRRDAGHRRAAPRRDGVVLTASSSSGPFQTDDWLAWNLGRSRAATARDSLPASASATSCTPRDRQLPPVTPARPRRSTQARAAPAPGVPRAVT